MPWVECANPQGLLDLILTDSLLADTQSGAAKPPQGSADDTTDGVELMQSGQLRVRLHRAWAISSDQVQRDSDGQGRVDRPENRHTTAAALQPTLEVVATGISSQCPADEDWTDMEGSGTVLVAALSQARAEAEQRRAAATVVCGSLYLVGEFLRLVEARSAVENTNG